jgi:hypothetical protein
MLLVESQKENFPFKCTINWTIKFLNLNLNLNNKLLKSVIITCCVLKLLKSIIITCCLLKLLKSIITTCCLLKLLMSIIITCCLLKLFADPWQRQQKSTVYTSKFYYTVECPSNVNGKYLHLGLLCCVRSDRHYHNHFPYAVLLPILLMRCGCDRRTVYTLNLRILYSTICSDWTYAFQHLGNWEVCGVRRKEACGRLVKW